MIKKSFFGLANNLSRFKYETLDTISGEPEKIPVPKKVTLFLKKPFSLSRSPGDSLLLNTGDKVKTGQKLAIYKDCDDYVISSVTGTVASISGYTGDFGKSLTAVVIHTDRHTDGDMAENEETDEQFGNKAGEPTDPDFYWETVRNFLREVPGSPCFCAFSDPDKPVKNLVICGTDRDMLTVTNQYVVTNHTDAVSSGISILKKISGADHVIVALPAQLMKSAGGLGGASGVEVRTVRPEYPAASPPMMMKDLMGEVVPAGKTPQDMGTCFFSAEAVASIGAAFADARIPLTKTLTLIKKDMTLVVTEARIGTPLSDIFNACNISVNDGDRIVVGGPMTGASVYSEDYPVQPDTDAVMIQAHDDLSLVSDYPCINCGECVRICPAGVPVNMLVRFCEAGEYEDAANLYDLHSCIECGLCSYVCVSKMPVLQHIRLAKYELAQMAAQEEAAEAEAEAEAEEEEAGDA